MPWWAQHAFRRWSDDFDQRAFATTVGPRQRDLVVTRVTVGRPTALGAWNELHAFPVASDFAEAPYRHGYMGVMPHG